MERFKVINKLRKLFALADDRAASKGEHLQAIKMAEALIAKHNIHTAELNDLENADGTPWSLSFEDVANPRPSIPNWEKLLVAAVGHMCGLKVIFKHIVVKGKSKRDQVRYVPSFYGDANDCAFGKVLFTELHKTAKACAQAAKKKAAEMTYQEVQIGPFSIRMDIGSVEDRELPKNFEYSHLVGFAEAVATRVAKKGNEHLTPKESKKNALVVIGKKKWLDKKMEETFPDMESSPAYKRPGVDPHAHRMGVNDGSKAQLGARIDGDK